MTYWELYWITRLDSIQNTMGGICAVSFVGVCLIFAFFCMLVSEGDTEYVPSVKRCIKYLATITLVSGFLNIMLPSNKDLALMMSGHFVTNSDQLQKLPDNLLKYLNDYLEEKKK